MNHDSPSRKPVTPAALRLQLGVFGRLFGDKDHAPGNIAGAVALLGILLIALSLFVPDAAVAGRLLEIGFTMTGNAVAYLFGRSSR